MRYIKENSRAKVAFIGTVGIPSRYGGFETLVEQITAYRNASDTFEYVVYCESSKEKERTEIVSKCKTVYVHLRANGWQSILYDGFCLFHAGLNRINIAVLLGVSGAIFIPVFKRIFPKIIIITNPDGLEWTRPKWSNFTRRFLKFSEEIAVKHSHAVVADNIAIRQYLLHEYNKDSVFIPYGGDHAIFPIKDDFEYTPPVSSYYLALCRIEPENNIEMILDAFVRAAEYNILFIGNWDHSSYSRSIKRKYSGLGNISLIDPIYDLKILYDLRSKSIGYIHGHSAGGSNPSLIEMMYFGKVILAFDCIFNRETTKNKTFYFINSESLTRMVKSIDPEEAIKIGEELMRIATKEYNWTRVATSYNELFLFELSKSLFPKLR